jgi:hypothetical protein
MAGVAFAGEGDGVGFATESYAASALYTTLANHSGAFWRIRRVRLATRVSLLIPAPEQHESAYLLPENSVDGGVVFRI